MSGLQFTVELLKVILGAPFMIGLVSLIFLLVFKEDVRALLRRIATVKFPGGELTTSQAERGVGLPSIDKPIPSPPTVDSSSIPGDVKLSPEDQQKLTELFDSEKARATLWEYQFLNSFLVLHTQRVLDWLASLPQRTSYSMYDAFWTPIIQDPSERRAIIDVLKNHYLLVLSGELIEVTPKGREYIQWRGPMPTSP